jgi:hypothetical protein
MVALVQRRTELASHPTLEKMWAEAIYEAVRLRVLPDAPSRLACLYAVEMGYDAFDILPERGLANVTFGPDGLPTSGPAILAARTSGRWVPIDMRLLQIPDPLAAHERAISEELERTQSLAERYWAGEASTAPTRELLCEGLERGA